MNWQTFSELAFSFSLTGEIFYQSLLFSLGMDLSAGCCRRFALQE